MKIIKIMQLSNCVKLIVALLFSVVCCGCFPVSVRPVLPALSLELNEQQQIKTSMHDPRYASKYLRSLYQVQFREGKQVSNIRQAVITKLPKRFRLESLPVNGFYTLNLLVIDDGQAEYYDQSSKKQIISSDVDQLVEQEIGIALPATFLPFLFMARVPEDFIHKYNWTAYRSDLQTILLVDQSKTMYWYVNEQDGSLKSVQFWEQFSDQLRMQIDYQNYQTVDGLVLPATFILKVPLADFSVSYSLQQLRLTEQVNDNLFKRVAKTTD